MKFVFLSTLLRMSFALKCIRKTPSFVLDWTNPDVYWDINWQGITLWSSLAECGTYNPWIGVDTRELWSCSSARFQGTGTKPGLYWPTGQWPSIITANFTFESEVKNCGLDAVCEKLAGGVNGCRFAEWDYEKWIPKTCDASTDYGATIEQYSASVSLSCCDSVNNCNENEDYDPCTQDVTFGNYIEDMQSCWNDVKKTFMSELLCDSEGNPTRGALFWAENCTEPDGSWTVAKRGSADCPYTPTCSQELRDTLTVFGECACTAATDHNYTGDFIATAMETNWDRYCPNIELSCSTDNGLVQLWYKYWLIRYRLRVAIARAAITDAILDAIKEAVAKKLNADPSSIEVTVTPATGSARRLLADETDIEIDFTAEDENTGTYGKTTLNALFATEIGDDIGYATTHEETTKEEMSDNGSGAVSGGTEAPETTKGESDKAVNVYTFCVWCLIVFIMFIN